MPMYFRKLLAATVAASLVFALPACSESAQEETTSGGQSSGGQTSGGQTMAESGRETTMTEETTEAMVGAGEVTVGGFVVESPGVPASEVPEIETSREDVNEYLGQVRPVVDDTVRDISGLVNPEVEIGEDGSVSIDPNVTSLDEASRSVEDGANALREIQPPEGLEPVNDRLVTAYEEALPAYQNIAEAAGSGDPERFASATQESLPQIQAFNTEVNAIIEDLEQATGQAGG
jgi:hypothetical protein